MEAPRPVQTGSNRDLSACDLLSGNAAVLLILFLASGYFSVWFILEGGGGFVKGAFLYCRIYARIEIWVEKAILL